MDNIRGVKRKTHIRYALESQYWSVRPQNPYLISLHIELFPNKRFLPEDVLVTLKEIIMFTRAGGQYYLQKCLASFTSDQVSSMLDLMDPLMSSIDKGHEHSVWIVARFMGEFCSNKFVNFCGQPGAWLDVDRSLYVDYIPPPKSILFRVINVILFGAPGAQSKALHKIWVDYEWKDYSVFSTVMLTVDISFLSVPPVQNQVSAIIVLYMSTLCALGSLVVSLVLAGQVNDSQRDSAESVVLFLFVIRLTCILHIHYQALFMIEMSQSMLGLESLALMLSRPYALLIWGIIFFAATLSIVIYCTFDVVIISIVSPIWFAIFTVSRLLLAANGIISHLKSWVAKQVWHFRS
ncbi:hypothetical protein BDR06DRAFT_1025354 [Suillus hirtellus]|nr:hypothetical protein BDR06DRAFT_1025354 [Suillus hirtellus]